MIKKILIEINRLKNELDGYSAREGLDYIESYINTLSKQQVEEPVSDVLEEAAEISFDEAKSLTEDYMDFLAKGLTENRPRPIGPHWFCEYAKNRFIAGAKWQEDHTPLPEDTVLFQNGVEEGKRLMMKEAVEWTVTTNLANRPVIYLDQLKGFQYGDKVRIIIVKED